MKLQFKPKLLLSDPNQNLQLQMMLKQLFLFFSIVWCRRITQTDRSNSFRDSMVALGTKKHEHAIVDEAFFYDFMSLSIEFNRQNLDEFVRVNLDPTFAGFTDEQFDSLLESWIFGMLSISYWSNFRYSVRSLWLTLSKIISHTESKITNKEPHIIKTFLLQYESCIRSNWP